MHALFFFQNRLRDEIHKYKQYLADQTRVEKERDDELEKMLNAEVNRQWEKRFHQWRKEKEARASLMKQVFDTRRQQIEDKSKSSREQFADFTNSLSKLLAVIV